MASSTSEQPSIALSDQECALLAWVVDLNGTSVGERIAAAAEQRSADRFDTAVGHAQLYAQLLRAAETGAFQPTAELVALVREHRTGTLGTVKGERRDLERIRAGDMDYCYSGMSLSESEEECLKVLDSHLSEVTVCDRILSQAAEGAGDGESGLPA